MLYYIIHYITYYVYYFKYILLKLLYFIIRYLNVIYVCIYMLKCKGSFVSLTKKYN